MAATGNERPASAPHQFPPKDRPRQGSVPDSHRPLRSDAKQESVSADVDWDEV
jgi:hypothetical protein